MRPPRRLLGAAATLVAAAATFGVVHALRAPDVGSIASDIAASGPTPISDPAQLPPPPYNRFIRPDTGRFEVLVWDDRPLTVEQKAALPSFDPRWKPFGHCMAAQGYEVRADATKPFTQKDVDFIVARANEQLPDAQANKRIGGNVDKVDGVAGAFLRCAGQWLGLAPADWPAHGIVLLPDGQIPGP